MARPPLRPPRPPPLLLLSSSLHNYPLLTITLLLLLLHQEVHHQDMSVIFCHDSLVEMQTTKFLWSALCALSSQARHHQNQHQRCTWTSKVVLPLSHHVDTDPCARSACMPRSTMVLLQ